MKNVLIIGATGTIGSAVHQTLLNETAAKLTLFARSADRLTNSDRETAMAGNVTSDADLDQAMQGQDTVFAALSGNLGNFAQKIVAAMDRNKVSRLLFITSMGIYNEIPTSVGGGNLNSNPMLRSYREAADIVEASDLNYTVIRPGWFTGGPVNYEVTRKGEPFGGHDVSVSSIADLVKRLVEDETLYSHDSVGLNTK
ncbi:NAD(P)-dependent oxidoreductase [Paucilactobacillus hokkaidonensis JCM 18461]|uniref:NAD(P)-dependent oxidoreductase n=2 Tax=Paucilactobacillus hokkaidonensis TaxID=1193095 RepID=A0A0A1GWC7_9LACO|nr:NAD(P)H-binding protein [Paucilactobacillus hokkaidonensis]KRO09999.1 NAD-dependent epimerase dehydratase [Paucilactobacillus hokkaidonensis]BAP86315.1 NAD(P)-dependent oxidoreductase [Paucilactobacillus hokkaidonensis JCM 18461]